MNEHWQTLVSIFETHFDAEESLKKADHKIKALQENPLKGQNKVSKYEGQKAKLFNAKRGAELYDRDWAEIISIFVLRMGELHGKDRKFDMKAKKLLVDSLPLITRAAELPPHKRSIARKYFPSSKKDYE